MMETEPTFIGRAIAGRFRVTAFLGEGAMARVYRGVQEPGGREVAIKILNPELANEETLRRFRREAKAASSLRHRNTVEILDYGIDGQIAYIAMELISGTDLFDVLVAEGRLSEARAARIVIQVCEALSAAHEHGIVHRDLKPENVMLIHPRDGGDERVKVLDFGIAKVLARGRGDDSTSTSSSLTSVGAVVGTPEYMSPEQCEDGDVDERSDIYACGVLLYRLVTGRVPFSSAVALHTMLRHLREAPEAPSTIIPALNPGLEAIILRTLSKDPPARPQTARALADELLRLLPKLAGARVRRPLPPSSPRTRSAPEGSSGPSRAFRASNVSPGFGAKPSPPRTPPVFAAASGSFSLEAPLPRAPTLSDVAQTQQLLASSGASDPHPAVPAPAAPPLAPPATQPAELGRTSADVTQLLPPIVDAGRIATTGTAGAPIPLGRVFLITFSVLFAVGLAVLRFALR